MSRKANREKAACYLLKKSRAELAEKRRLGPLSEGKKMPALAIAKKATCKCSLFLCQLCSTKTLQVCSFPPFFLSSTG